MAAVREENNELSDSLVLQTTLKVGTLNAGGGEPSADFAGQYWLGKDKSAQWRTKVEGLVGGVLLKLLDSELPEEKATKIKEAMVPNTVVNWQTAADEAETWICATFSVSCKPSENSQMTVGAFLGDEFKEMASETQKRMWFSSASPRVSALVAGAYEDTVLWSAEFDKILAKDTKKFVKTFADPDGCYGKRPAVFSNKWIELVQSSKFAADYFEQLKNAPSGKQSLCPAAAAASATTNEGLMTYHETHVTATKADNPSGNPNVEVAPEISNVYSTDWIPVAVLDKIRFEVARHLELPNPWQPPPVAQVNAIAWATDLITATMANNGLDVLFLQEAEDTPGITSELPGKQAAVRIPSDLPGDTKYPVDAAIIVKNTACTLGTSEPDGFTDACVKLLDMEACKSKVAIRTCESQTNGKFLLASVHSDSSAAKAVLWLAALAQFHSANYRTYTLVVGTDSNVKDKMKFVENTKDLVQEWGEPAFWEKADEMGYDASQCSSSFPTSVSKRRTSVQAQLQKGGKVDKVCKDWILVRSATAAAAEQGTNAVLNKYTAPKATTYKSRTDNLGTKMWNKFGANTATLGDAKLGYTLTEDFPNDAWPGDHFLVTVDVAAPALK